MTVEELKKTVRLGIAAADKGLSTVERMATEIAQATALARAVLTDSQHEEVTAGLGSLAGAAGEMGPTTGRLRESGDHANAYLARIS
jgi:hypothetical protein